MLARVAFIATLVLVVVDAAPARSPAVPERCLRGNEKAIRFRTSDGIRLAGGLLGKGKTGVVLVPQSNHDYCGFVPFARLLGARGYLALSVSLRNHGSSGREEVPNQHHPRDVAAASKELRRRGATKVFLIGASLGGTAVLTAAPDVDPPVAGVVDLSGPAEFTDMDALEAVPRLTAPALFVVGRLDTAFVADTRAMFRAAASADKKLVVRPGGEHGTALVDSRSGVVRSLIYGFLKAH